MKTHRSKKPHSSSNRKSSDSEQTQDFHESHDDDSRTVYLIGEINEEMIKSVVERLIQLSERDSKKPITMIISTYGGNIDDTFMLYDVMKLIKAPLFTVGLGKVMSAGCLLLAAGKKGCRKVGANTRIMYHCGYDEASGNIFAIEASLEAFKKQEAQYDKSFALETGLKIEEVESLYNKNGPTADRYIDATEAKRLGIVDVIL